MEARIMRVVQQGEAFAVQSQKSESGQVKKVQHPAAGVRREVRRPVRLHDVGQFGHLPLLPGRTGGRQPPLHGQRV